MMMTSSPLCAGVPWSRRGNLYKAGLQIAMMKEDERTESYEQLKIRSDDVYRRYVYSLASYSH